MIISDNHNISLQPLTNQELLDPLGVVICLLTPERTKPDDVSLTIRFSSETVHGIGAVAAKGASVIGQGSSAQWKVGFVCHTAFNRSEAGSRAIVDWMLGLPSLFEKEGLALLKNGEIEAMLT